MFTPVYEAAPRAPAPLAYRYEGPLVWRRLPAPPFLRVQLPRPVTLLEPKPRRAVFAYEREVAPLLALKRKRVLDHLGPARGPAH